MPALRYQPQAIGYFLEAGLTGNIGSRAFDLSDLGNWDSRRYSIGPTLYLPIFQGGRLESKLVLNETRHRLAGVACLQTVLRAWHEVDDALNAYATESRRHRQLQRALAQNQAASSMAQRAYQRSGRFYFRAGHLALAAVQPDRAGRMQHGGRAVGRLALPGAGWRLVRRPVARNGACGRKFVIMPTSEPHAVAAPVWRAAGAGRHWR